MIRYCGYIDSEIPVVVAYNLVHYESLEPLCDEDINGTVELVRSYIAKPCKYFEDYGFTGQDISYLISPGESVPKFSLEQKKNESLDASPQQHESTHDIAGFIYEDILFKETGDGKVICGVCKINCKRLIVHMNGNEYCTKYFSGMEDFKKEYSRYRHKRSSEKKEEFREQYSNYRHKEITKKHDEKEKEENIQKFKKDANEKNRGCEDKRKAAEKQKFQKDTNSAVKNISRNEKLIESQQKETIITNSEYFKSGDVVFKELGAGRIRCGVCKIECSRLVSHLNKNEDCSRSFCMPEFKKEYSNYRNRLRVKKHVE